MPVLLPAPVVPLGLVPLELSDPPPVEPELDPLEELPEDAIVALLITTKTLETNAAFRSFCMISTPEIKDQSI
jgi:hypothetical protein